MNFSQKIKQLKDENNFLKDENKRLNELTSKIVNDGIEKNTLVENTIAEYNKLILELKDIREEYEKQLQELKKVKEEFFKSIEL